MSKILRFLGRVLFVALLFHSAYYKLTAPDESKASFTRGYAKLHSCFNSYGLPYLPSEAEVPLTHMQFSGKTLLAVKFVGLIEALIASFILIGEHTGGYMALLYYVVYGALNFTIGDFTQAHSKTFAQREKLVAWVALLGGSLLLASKNYLKA